MLLSFSVTMLFSSRIIFSCFDGPVMSCPNCVLSVLFYGPFLFSLLISQCSSSIARWAVQRIIFSSFFGPDMYSRGLCELKVSSSLVRRFCFYTTKWLYGQLLASLDLTRIHADCVNWRCPVPWFVVSAFTLRSDFMGSCQGNFMKGALRFFQFIIRGSSSFIRHAFYYW